MTFRALRVTAVVAFLSASDRPADAAPLSRTTAVERTARERVDQTFERHGRRAPELDSALSLAARALATRALHRGRAQGSGDLLVVSDAVSRAGGFDPQPKVVAMIFSPKSDAQRALAQANDFLAEDPSSHVGIGAAEDGQALALVLLFVRRQVSLDPFSRKLPKPTTRAAGETLCGDVPDPYRDSELFITLPNGDVEKHPATPVPGRPGRFCTPLPFAERGRYTVELLVRGPQGPEVAALFFVDVGRGEAAARGPDAAIGGEEPKNLTEARQRLLDRINKLRRGHGMKTLAPDPDLDRIAQGLSTRMASEHFFAHVSPDGQDLKARLQAAGYRYRTAGENLGAASGPMAAHFGIEHSPGHRKNLLDPAHSRLGLGVSVEQLADGRRQAVVTELLASVYEPSLDPLADAYRAIADQRRGAGLRPALRSAELERIAQEEAERALKTADPRVRKGEAGPYRRALAVMVGAESVTIDVYIADSPTVISESKNLRASGVNRVGVGIARGSTQRYGDDKLWIYAIYVELDERPKPGRRPH